MLLGTGTMLVSAAEAAERTALATSGEDMLAIVRERGLGRRDGMVDLAQFDGGARPVVLARVEVVEVGVL